jgi:hypothetical protein
MNLEQTDI